MSGGAAPPTSVLMPVRDAVTTVDAALQSVLDQSDGDFELLAIDDGSSDGTLERLRAAEARDPRVRVLSRAGSPGDLVAALRLACEQARGDALMRMDADDVSHARRLELCRLRLDADPRLGVVSCLVRSFPELEVRAGRRRYDAWLNGLRDHASMARERFVESPLAHPATLIRASALASVGGYRELPLPEDYDLWLRLFAAGWRFSKVPRVLHFWRESPGRLSRVDARYDRRAFTRARAEALAHHLGGRGAAIVGAGAAGRRLARALLDRGVELRYFLDLDPRKVGRRPHGVEVRAAERLAERGGELLITAVNAWGQRQALRAFLRGGGLREGEDFVVAG